MVSASDDDMTTPGGMPDMMSMLSMMMGAKDGNDNG